MAMEGDLILMHQVSTPPQRDVARSLAPLGLQDNAGNPLKLRNLHQSFSCVHPPSCREALQRVVSAVTASAFAMHLDVVRSEGSEPGKIHVQFADSGKKPYGMEKLQTELFSLFAEEGIHDAVKHSAHLTLNYFAQQRIKPIHVRPVTLIIDTIELVEVRGRGDNYRYEPIETLHLLPMTEPPAIQLHLLA